VEFDVCRAYTSFLAEVTQVPVFSVFDELRPYDGSAINPLGFYYVKTSQTDAILFPMGIDLVPGATVLYARERGIELELLGVAQPCRLLPTNGEATLRALYDADVSEATRKAIPNIAYGLANKGVNRKQVATCHLDMREAMANSGYIKDIGPGYIAVRQGVKDLREGYLPVGRLVLDAMRRRLHATVAALGGDAVAVRTDAVYVRIEHGDRAEAALRAAGFHLPVRLEVDMHVPATEGVDGLFRVTDEVEQAAAVGALAEAVADPSFKACAAIWPRLSGSNLPALSPAGRASPFSQTTASGSIFQILAARSRSWVITRSVECVTTMAEA
jgi:hypothetical protein